MSETQPKPTTCSYNLYGGPPECYPGQPGTTTGNKEDNKLSPIANGSGPAVIGTTIDWALFNLGVGGKEFQGYIKLVGRHKAILGGMGLKFAGGIGAGTNGLWAAIENYEDYRTNRITGFQAITDTAAETSIGATSAVIGTYVGMCVGSVVPVAGTLAGAAAGAVVGGLIGWGLKGLKNLVWQKI